MKFAVSCLLEYQTQQPVTFLLNVRAHEGEGQHCLSETLHLPNGLEHRIANCAATGTRFDQIHAPYAGQHTLRYEAEVDVNVQTFAANRPSKASTTTAITVARIA